MHERRDLDELVAPVRVPGVPGTEVDSVDPVRREVGDVRPGLLRLDRARAGRDERVDERALHDTAGRRMARDLERRGVRDQPEEIALGFLRRSVGCVAKVERRGRGVGNDVVGDARVEPGDRHDLDERQPTDLHLPVIEREQGLQTADGVLDRVVSVPGACGMAARPVEHESGDHVSEATRLHAAIGRLEHDRERGLPHERRLLEQGGEGIVLDGELFAAEEYEGSVDRAWLALEVPDELERHRKTAFHVARAEAVHRALLDPTGEVALSGDGVVVACKDDERCVGAPLGRKQEDLVSCILDRERLPDERKQVLANLALVTAFRGDVYELERTRGEALGERSHSASVQRHNPPVTPRQPDRSSDAEPERGFVLGVFAKGADGEDELVELRELARTAGVLPVAELVQHRDRPDPRTFVGKGKLEELKSDYAASDAEVLLVDEELSPTQQRTLENTLESRVVDRTQLILDIFAQHARSAEGKLQVELAQLEYNLPRMRGMWQHLERLGGGVGTRGPGESQLETDRRLARTRVSLVKRRLRGLGDQRAVRRKERQRSSAPTIALAGYTNVGKSTLLNALTGAKATVDDRLFETLDPMTRAFEHQGKRYLLTDTVGFIRRLPTQLVEGFAATLEDTLVADLVLHVADGSLQESRLRETIAAVQSVLHDIGADDVPVELVFNKVDVLDPIARGKLESGFPRALQVSAATGEGLDELRDRIAELFSDRFEDVRLLVPYQDGSALAELYDLGTPIAERRDTAEGVRVRARLPRREIPRFARFLVAGEPEAEAAAP